MEYELRNFSETFISRAEGVDFNFLFNPADKSMAIFGASLLRCLLVNAAFYSYSV